MINFSLCSPEPMKSFSPHPAFGTVFTPHILKMHLELNVSPQSAEITPLAHQDLLPSISSLHYGQCIFEGMKAYKKDNGKINLFRPNENALRFERSAKRLNMAPVPPNIFIECLKTFINFERNYVPSFKNHSLYIRPLLIAADQKLKVGQSQKYLFYILGSVVGDYFSAGSGKESIKVAVNRDFIRAFPGGLGNVKASANYAMSMSSQAFAIKHDCDQVLYLDSISHENIDELGGMNFFAIRGEELVTPQLNNCILPGITRDSLLKLAHKVGLQPKEETMSFSQLIKDIQSNKVSEIFACGTAATIQPIGELSFFENSQSSPKSIILNNPFNKSLELRKLLLGMQMGHIKPLQSDWITEI